MNVLIAAELLHAVSQAYMTRLAAEKTTVSYNRLLELEFAEVAFTLVVVEKHGTAQGTRESSRYSDMTGIPLLRLT